MNNNKFSPDHFFDLSDVEFAEIFKNVIHVWEILPKIADYITSCFQQTGITGNYKDQKDVFIGEGTVIDEGVKIEGPSIIGKNCILRHGSFLRSFSLLADNVQIGHAVEVKNSIFLPGAKAAHLNYVGDSIIGKNVNIAGGAMIANFRLDKKLVTVSDGHHKHETGLEKFGSIIGDDSSIGANVILNPGTILGKHTIVYPLVSVKGFHEAHKVIR